MWAVLAIFGGIGPAAMAADVQTLEVRCAADDWQACPC